MEENIRIKQISTFYDPYLEVVTLIGVDFDGQVWEKSRSELGWFKLSMKEVR